MVDENRVREAISFIPSHERDLWVSIGMSLKSGLGDSGKSIWIEWSSTASNYKERDALAVWRSCKPHGGITIASLFHHALQAGWKGVVDEDERRKWKEEATQRQLESEASDRQTLLNQRNAARKAIQLVQSAKPQQHEYLIGKGHGDIPALVGEDGRMIVPMWSCDLATPVLQSLQFISASGEKKMLFQGRAKCGHYKLGDARSVEHILCEGYATALSIRKALASLSFRHVAVWTCFSAAGIAACAPFVRGKAWVVADNDANGTGMRYATSTGLPWWMPPDVDTDFNDFHASYGIRDAAVMLSKLKRS